MKKKKIFALLGAILSGLYIISPVDLIPGDLLSIVGLIDDAAVLPIFLACLKVLGVDFSSLLGKRGKKNQTASEAAVVDVD